MKTKKNKKQKAVTKGSIKRQVAKLKRKLLKMWSEACREKENFTCIFCGAKRGEPSKLNPNSVVKIDSHHLLQKEIRNSPLKYEIKNSAVLCASCHKYNSFHSAHKSPIVFYDWMRLNHNEKYEFVLKNSGIRIDLDKIEILEEIEKSLLEKKSLDLPYLIELDKKLTPKTPKVEVTEKDDFFGDEEKTEKSSSSSSS
jgi:hypothetical protein